MEYNVVCNACGAVYSPTRCSGAWWKAKQRAEKGYLDAARVSGKECGCQDDVREPDAPYRVVGYDGFCRDYNIPFSTFVEAVKTAREYARAGDVVFLVGVSEAVKAALR